MVKKQIIWFLLLLPLIAWAAATTLTGSGDWDDSSNWDLNNIADDISEDVDWDNNVGTVTIRNTFSYTVSDMAMNNGNTLTIASGGTLNVGNTGTGFTLATGNTATINVDGDLTIWGTLDVGNTLTLNVTGTLTIKGDINMGNGGTLDIQGNVQVDGAFTGGNNTNVNVDGDLTVDGGITVGTPSSLTGSGTVNEGTGCTGPPEFCTSGPLPVTLSYFEAKVAGTEVNLSWQTLTEENFEYFSVQRSKDLIDFEEIERVQGGGDSQVKRYYSYIDQQPIDGTSYYRLKSVDYDGYTEIFNAVSVFAESKNNFWIYPSLLTGATLNVQYQSIDDRTSNLRIMDLSGRNKYESTLDFNGTVEIPYGLENGIYFVELIDQDIINRSRIIISR